MSFLDALISAFTFWDEIDIRKAREERQTYPKSMRTYRISQLAWLIFWEGERHLQSGGVRV